LLSDGAGGDELRPHRRDQTRQPTQMRRPPAILTEHPDPPGRSILSRRGGAAQAQASHAADEAEAAPTASDAVPLSETARTLSAVPTAEVRRSVWSLSRLS
jgi:hypothetical protein